LSDETQDQVTITPEDMGEAPAAVEAPVTETPAEGAPVESPQADYAALELDVAKLGDGYTLSNIGEKMADMKRGMNEAQRTATENDQRYSQFTPLLERVQNDADYARALQKATQEYFEGDGTSADVPPEVSASFEPLNNRIAQMENQLAGEQMDRTINELKAGGMPIDDQAYNQIMQRVIDTRSRDVTAHAWALLGPKMVAGASKDATHQTADQIKKNNEKYVNTPTGVAPDTKPFDVTEASAEQVEAEFYKDLSGYGIR